VTYFFRRQIAFGRPSLFSRASFLVFACLLSTGPHILVTIYVHIVYVTMS